MPGQDDHKRRTSGKFKRARFRHALFTIAPDRLSGGALVRKHLKQEIVTKHVSLTLPGWPAHCDGMRIGHFSDFHYGDLLPLERGLEAVEILSNLSPDLVACTGDVVDLHHEGVDPLMQAIGSIDAPLGSFLVLGNHDHLDDPVAVASIAEDSGINVLEDRVMRVPVGDHVLNVGGIGWAKKVKQLSGMIDRLETDHVDLLLSHNPKAFIEASRRRIPLTLAGHTHGGQVAARNNTRRNLAFAHRHNAGLYWREPSALYVTTGIGSWFPIRVHCPPEVVLIELRNGPFSASEEPA